MLNREKLKKKLELSGNEYTMEDINDVQQQHHHQHNSYSYDDPNIDSGVMNGSYATDIQYTSSTTTKGTTKSTKKDKNTTGKTNRPPKMRQKKYQDEDENGMNNNRLSNGSSNNSLGSPHDSDGDGQRDSNGSLMKRRKKTELQIQV